MIASVCLHAETEKYPDPLLTTPGMPEMFSNGLEADAYSLAVMSYIWGYPLVRMERVIREYIDVRDPKPDISSDSFFQHRWTGFRDAQGFLCVIVYVRYCRRRQVQYQRGINARGNHPPGSGQKLLYIGVNDITATLKQVEAKGGTVDVPRFEVPGVAVLGLFRDLAGNPLRLVEMGGDGAKIP